MKVYIGKMANNDVIVDTDPGVLKGAEILGSMPLEEFQGLGHRSVEAVIEGGRATLRFKEPVARRTEVTRYKAQLSQIDKDAGIGRAGRALLIRMAGGAGIGGECGGCEGCAMCNMCDEGAKSDDYRRIRQAENRAEAIRARLRSLLGEGEEG